ncbi:MAG TPA: 30S ribosome-binding factor RbfA [Planctomycetota bacterium]|nr:30S ribosome-binding factor RbfA [Planctomycetota bacterium]
MTSRRSERFSRLLKETVSAILLRELSDPRMGFVTVTKVEPSRDLTFAKVYLSVLGEENVCRRTMQGIRHAAGFIRRRVGQEITLRTVPELRFVRDDSVKRALHISQLIDDAVADSHLDAEREQEEP